MIEKFKTNDVISTLWIFTVVNYIFCDIFTLHYAPILNLFLTGKVGDLELTQEFLLIFAFIVEISMLMIVLSKYLPYKMNRYFNIVTASFMALQQSATLTQGFTLHYLFFSIIEVSATLTIVWLAIKWKKPETDGVSTFNPVKGLNVEQ